MGLATEPERLEFEAACAQYPEIAEARNTFELALEEQLLRDAVAPPAYLKQRIEGAAFGTETMVESPATETNGVTVHRIAGWKWLAAACLVVMAGTLIWALNMGSKYKALQAENRDLQNQVVQSTARLDSLRQDTRILQRAGVKMATMKGTDPSMYATVYWDTTASRKDVYLLVNNLPATASDKQYQLWALLDGKPIDLGMIEPRQERLLVRMKNVQNAQAFAITIEPKGGSATPTSTPIVISQ